MSLPKLAMVIYKAREMFKLPLKVLDKFVMFLPGGTYLKKLFYWNLIQYLLFWLWGLGSRALMGDVAATDPVMFWVDLMVTYPFTNDGHIYGDLVFVLTGLELRWLIWPFSLLAVVVLSYFWAFRDSKVAKFLRIGSYLVSLSSFLVWSIFFTWDPRYDYYFWAVTITSYHFLPIVILMAITALFAMWFGAIISNGYLIYNALKERTIP